jgi:uroporphyrinogen decarboxylase
MSAKMTRRERVRATIARKPCDGVPCAFDIVSAVSKKLLAHYQIEPSQLPDTIGEHLQYISPSYARERMPDGQYRDEFGTVWEWRDEMSTSMGDVGRLVEPVLKQPSLEGWTMPDGRAPRFSYVDVEALRQSDRFVVLGMSSLFEMCWFLRGFEHFLEDLAGEPQFVYEVMDVATEHLISIIEQTPEGVDAVRLLEDWGLQKGMMMSPRHWRTYLKPRLREIYSAAHRKNLMVMLHSCGDIHEIIPDLVELGVNVIHPVQPEVMDLAFLTKEYGRDLTFYGGIGCQSTLVYGTPEDTVAEAKLRVKTLGVGGGYILGPAGAFSADTKFENAVALIEYAKTLF